MTQLVYRCFAKVNLHLQVLGRRGDGFHQLSTVFQTIDLHDLLGVELAQAGVRLEVRRGNVPAGEENLAVIAARRFLELWAPDRGVRLWLEKRIPVGGGLGGGSSDAATVLLALQEQLGNPASVRELEGLARELGSDVPYFLLGGTALGVGRGDEVTLTAQLAPTELWVVTPPLEVSTAVVFARVDALTNGSGVLTAAAEVSSILAAAQPPGEERLRFEDLAGVNDLSSIVFNLFPEVGRLYNLLSEAGAASVRLSGTGASLFARFESREAVAGLKRVLPRGTGCVCVRTLSRDAVVAARSVRGVR